MNWSWGSGRLDEEYSLDDYIDMYLQVSSLAGKTNKIDKDNCHFYSHCLECLSKSFGFDIVEKISNLDDVNQNIVNQFVQKALQIRTPTSGYQMASIFHSEHGTDLKDINSNTGKIIKVYREIIKKSITHKNDIKRIVSKQDILNSGYDKSLIPKYDDIF